MNNFKNIFFTSLVVLTLVIFGLGGAQTVLAWDDAPANPPACDPSIDGCNPPINVSASAQTKIGPLYSGTTLGLNRVIDTLANPATFFDQLISGIYNSYDALNIFGHGTAGNRNVKIWDNLNVVSTTTTTNLVVLNRTELAGGNTYTCVGSGAARVCSPISGGGSGGGWTEDSAGNKIYTTTATRNVGIGTTVPAGKLEVASSGTNNSELYVTTDPSSTVGSRLILRNDQVANPDDGALQLGSFSSSYNSGAPAGGYYPDSAVFSAQAGLSNGISFVARSTSANADIRFYTNGYTNQRMIITNAGNVGIGSTSPQEKLDVAGDVCSVVGGVRRCLQSVSGGGGTYTAGNNTLNLVSNAFSVNTTTIQARVTGNCVNGIRSVGITGVATCAAAPTATPVATGMYGYCNANYSNGGTARCSSATAPATCVSMACGCASGYTKISTGFLTDTVTGGTYGCTQTSCVKIKNAYYSCLKN
jgi:hypothetical protein